MTIKSKKKIHTVLFDADGVLTLPEEVFSIMYSKSRGLELAPFEDFFQTQWKPIVTGKKDLKESIIENQDLWQWSGTPDELLQYWFEAEDVRNDDLIKLISKVKEEGIQCCLATDQERYRGEYMKNIMFKDLFDHYFISADLGVLKTDPQFFKLVLEKLRDEDSLLEPSSVVFFDDSKSKVEAAKLAGLSAYLYKDVGQVRGLLLG